MTEQPHFDDELTVLTAQQVVPLAKVRTRRRLVLGGAFAVAMLLGAASAVISAYFKLRNVPDPEIQPSSVLSVSETAPPAIETIPERPKPKPKPRHTEHTLQPIKNPVLIDEWQERRERRVERPNSQHRNRDLSNIDEIFEGVRHP